MSPARTKLDRRARLAIASGLLFFVTIQVSFRITLAWHPTIGDREFGQKLEDLRARIAESPGQPLVVMLGSSRVATGFKPKALPQLNLGDNRQAVAFNFAQVGVGPQLSHLVLHRLLAHGIRPDYVLVEFWPPFWATDGYLNGYIDSLNLAALDWPAVKLLARYLQKPKALYSKWLPAQLAPIFASRFVLLSRMGASWAPNFDRDRRLLNLDPSGWWAPRTTIDAADRARLVEHYRGIYGDRLNHFKIRPTPDRALQDLLSLCRSEGIKVAVVVLPESQAFRALYTPDALQSIKTYLANLARNIPVIDAREWVADDGFSDGHHLLPTGATTFTDRLGREALAPLLHSAPPRLLTRPDLPKIVR